MISSLEGSQNSAVHPRGDWRQIIPGLLVTISALGLLFSLTDLNKTRQALLLADYRYVLLAVLVTLAWLYVRSRAWGTLLQGRAKTGHVFWAINQGYLLNNLLPFRLGEFARAYLLSRKTGLNFWQIFSTIMLERLLDLGLAVVLLLVTLPFVIEASWAVQAALSVGILVVVGFAGLFIAARNRAWVEKLLAWFSQRWRFFSRIEQSILLPLMDGLVVLASGWRSLEALVWFLANWGLGILQYEMMVRAFFPNSQLSWGAFCLGVAALGVAAPSSPGSIGVFEGAVVFALSRFGQDPSVALALALTLHLIQIVVTGILGAIALGRDGETLLGLYRRVRLLSKR